MGLFQKSKDIDLKTILPRNLKEEEEIKQQFGITDDELAKYLSQTPRIGMDHYPQTEEDYINLRKEKYQSYLSDKFSRDIIQTLGVPYWNTCFFTRSDGTRIVDVQETMRRHERYKKAVTGYPKLALGMSIDEAKETIGELGYICDRELTAKGEKTTYLLEIAKETPSMDITEIIVKYVKTAYLDNKLIKKNKKNLLIATDNDTDTYTDVEAYSYNEENPNRPTAANNTDALLYGVRTVHGHTDAMKEVRGKISSGFDKLQFGMTLEDVESIIGNKNHESKEELLDNGLVAKTYQWNIARELLDTMVSKYLSLTFIDNKLTGIEKVKTATQEWNKDELKDKW